MQLEQIPSCMEAPLVTDLSQQYEIKASVCLNLHKMPQNLVFNRLMQCGELKKPKKLKLKFQTTLQQHHPY